MKNNKIFTLISLEELPAHDPFAGGTASTSESEEGSNQTSSSSNDINGIRLIGTVLGDSRNVALILTPNGSTNVHGENEFISDNIQLLDIGHDWISVRLNAEENYEISINGTITPQEGN